MHNYKLALPADWGGAAIGLADSWAFKSHLLGKNLCIEPFPILKIKQYPNIPWPVLFSKENIHNFYP